MKQILIDLHSRSNANGLIPVHLYLSLFAIAAIEAIWILSSRVTFVTGGMTGIYFEIPLISLLLYFCIRRMNGSNAAGACRFLRFWFEAMLILKLGWVILRLFNHLTMTTAMPLQDNMLILWDSYLGSLWLPYFEFVHNHPQVTKLLSFGYTSLTPLSAVMLFFLIIIGEYDRAKFFIVTFFYTAIVAMALGSFFPARAAVSMLIDDIGKYTNFSHAPGTYHLIYLESLRAQTEEIKIFLENMPGLVTFPSFHTSAGIILMASYWQTPFFLGVFMYSVLMIASTPVFGSHYIIDLLGGGVLAVVVIGFTRHMVPKTTTKVRG